MSEALTSSNSRKSPYISSEPLPYSFKYSEARSVSKDPIELIRKKLVYSDDNVKIPGARIVSEKLAEGSNIVDKAVADDDRSEKESGDHLRSYRAAAWETYPIINLENGLEMLYGDKTIPMRSKNNEETVQKNISTFMEANSLKHFSTNQKSMKDCYCSCSPTSDKTLTQNKIENNQLEHACSCKKYDKKYKAPFRYERSVSNKIVSKNIGVDGEENCCTSANCDTINRAAFNAERKFKYNTNYDSMGYTEPNSSEETKYENFKGNTAVRFLTSTPKSAVSKGLLTENVPNYCTNITCDSTNYSTINFRSVDDPSTKVVHRIGYENDLRIVSKDLTRIPNFCTEKNCDLTHFRLSGQDIKRVNTTEPRSTVSTAMDTLEGMLLGIKNYHDKSRMKYGMQEYQHSDVKCRNLDCNVATDVNHNSVDCMKPECIRMLEEIKECTKTLEEQLAIMNKSIKVKKSKQKKDTVTQEPEKENVCVQEPSFNDFKFVKCTQNLEMKLKNNVDSKKGKLVDKSFQGDNDESRRLKEFHGELCCSGRESNNFTKETMLQNDKKMAKLEELKCCTAREKVRYFKKETLLQCDKGITKLEELKCCREDCSNSCSERERIHNVNKKTLLKSDKKIKKLEESKCCREDNPKYTSEQERIHNSKKLLQKSENKDNSSTNESSSLKTIKIGNYSFGSTQFEPLTASVGDDKDLSEKICLCPFPDRTSIFSNRNLLKRQEKKTRLSGLISQPLKKERSISLGNINQNLSNCPEKTMVMLFLTKGVNNSYLKSRYKRIEFNNFKPKCLMNETNNKNYGKSKRRRIQVPAVLRQLKSVQCKIVCSESTENNEKICFHATNQPSCKMSNLLTTVCTQSSNLYITTATSVSRVSFVNNSDDYDKENIPDRPGACILS
ncbi:uncharacterized protein LOC143355511 [Halictus rubicundus]|uniref:uncharacterized protein LOC143355511 n=1 Tax=Halictus rubicundus TaxID=77578 RepID=UPI004036BD85